MTTSTLPARYKINGLMDTKRSVMDNMEKICNACGTFMTYDIHEGKWGIVVNKAESTVAKAFTDANIIGPVQVQGTSILNLYNKVRVEYTLRDTADSIDFIEIEIPAGDRYPNEPDNVLQIQLEMCNEPVQAEIIGLIELKQARIDQIVTFESDYSTLNLNAGDLITLTHDLYQFNAKPFRVITLSEVDSDDGAIRIQVTALAYDANVYDTSDLGRYIRSDRNGIKGIGSIGQPIEPVLYIFQQDRRPGISVESIVPDGIVESMELWLSSDNTNFKQIGTQYPVGGGTYTAGATVLFDYDQLESQNIYVKVRGMNSTTTGPFSTVDSFLGYVPTQTPDAIPQSAPVVDTAGNLLPALLISKIAGWALSKTSDWASSGGVLSQLGLTPGDFTQASGAPANVGFTLSSQIATAAYTEQQYNAYCGTATLQGFQGNLTSKLTYTFTVAYNGNALQFTCESPYGTMDYQYQNRSGSSVVQTNVLMYFPSLIKIFKNNVQLLDTTVDWQTQSTTITITPGQAGGSIAGTWKVEYTPLPTYDLDMTNPFNNGPEIYCYNLDAQRDTRVLLQLFG
jgi:hypothetical protein